MNKDKKTFNFPTDFAQVASEVMAWTFFLVMLGEIAWSETDKKKIINFYKTI